jgi:hypothetical protein
MWYKPYLQSWNPQSICQALVSNAHDTPLTAAQQAGLAAQIVPTPDNDLVLFCEDKRAKTYQAEQEKQRKESDAAAAAA